MEGRERGEGMTIWVGEGEERGSQKDARAPLADLFFRFVVLFCAFHTTPPHAHTRRYNAHGARSRQRREGGREGGR